MKRKVLLISRTDAEGWWNQTMLSRPDVVVTHAFNYRDAFQLLVEEPFDLFIAEEWPEDEGLAGFVSSVCEAVRVEGLKGVVICDRAVPDFRLPPVQFVLERPVTASAMDRAIAAALGIPMRSSRRYLVRMHLKCGSGFGDAKVLGSAVTVRLSGSGMLIESLAPLQVGESFRWSFSGVGQLKGILFPGTVIREEPVAPGHGFRCYVVHFDPSAVEHREILEHYLSKVG